jgi:hypothetical protein
VYTQDKLIVESNNLNVLVSRQTKELKQNNEIGYKVYQLLAHGRWFSPGTPSSPITKTGRHDVTEILLKVALKHKKSKQNQSH